MEENERTLYENLEYLNETKGIIKQAIIDKGVEVSADTPFREYADKIGDIQGGSGDLDDVITAQEQYIAELEAIIDEKASGGDSKKQIISNSRYTFCVVPSVYEQNLTPELESSGLSVVYGRIPYRYETDEKAFAVDIIVVPSEGCALSGKAMKFKLSFLKGDTVLIRGNERLYSPVATYPSYSSLYLSVDGGVITDEILEEMTDIKIEYEIVE